MKARYMTSCAVAAIVSGGAGALAAETSASTAGIEEITVTAARRVESVRDVPSTIQAFSAARLEQLNIQTVNDLIKYTPNVTFASNGPGAGNIFMRGLSSGFAGNQSSAAVGTYPNVAIYLDEQSMTFPFRNVDVYSVDLERIEILEGPQGTLFGGGAEAGAVRYITNKPKLDVFEGHAEAMASNTEHGDPSYGLAATFNAPIIEDKLGIRATVYNERRGGYIDNVASTFTRKPSDLGPSSYGTVYPANLPSYSNSNLAERAQNPLTYTGFRISGLYKINDDWDALVQQSYQMLDAEGMNAQYPYGSDGQKLGPWETTTFSPVHDKDRFNNTSWTINGKVMDLHLVYTGGYLSRHIDQTQDYTNYARSAGGFYYSCVGGPASASDIGAGTPPTCYSPISSWHDIVKSTHESHEFRVSTPSEWRVRGIVGAYYENFDIKDDMNFLYKSIPSCTPANLAAFKAGGPICLGNVAPAPGVFANDPSARPDNVAFGEDQDRGYKQLAFFGSADVDIIPKVLTVSGGTRHYDYTEFMIGSQYSTGTGCVGIPNGTCYGTAYDAAAHRAHYTGWSSRANVTWHIVPDAMVYYTYSEGFRPGAGNRLPSAVSKIDINPATGQATTGIDNSPTLVKQIQKPSIYAPDTLINHEIGFKTEFFDHRLQVNGSAYYMQWLNVQTLIFNPPVFGNTTFGVNGPNYDVKGVELQAVARPFEDWTFDGSMSYNNSRETNSPCIKSSNPVKNNPTPIGSCVTQIWSGSLHMNVPVVNPLGAIGATPAFSPKLQFSTRARYDWDLMSYHGFTMVGVNYTGKMYNEPSSFQSGDGIAIPTTTYLRYTQPSYTTVDASLGVIRNNWTVEIFGTNLTNSNASTFTSTAQFIVSQVPLRPRVVGVRASANFN